MKPLKRTLRHPSGSILILALWVLTFCGLIAASLSFRTGLALRLTQYQWKEIQSEQLAKAAVSVCRAIWIQQRAPYAAFNQFWADHPDLFQDHAVSDGFFTVCRTARDERGLARRYYGMEDESGKINLNSAPAEALARLFGTHADVVPAILEWRDPRPQGRAGGVPQSDYQTLGYTCRNGPFRSLEELLLVKGMNPELFQDVQESLTVYSSGQVNINTASERVLQALGLSPSLAQKIVVFRKGPDGVEGTPDDGVFPSLGTLAPLLKEKVSLAEDERRVLAKLLGQNRLTVQTDSLRLHLFTRLSDSGLKGGAPRAESRGRFVAVLGVRTKPERLLYWRERMP